MQSDLSISFSFSFSLCIVLQKFPQYLIHALRLCLATCKIFSKCKIFSLENGFGKGKYFQVFGCIILKIALENI